MGDPAIAEFPAELWGSIAARRARTFRSWLQTDDDGHGYRPLRQAIADYLGSSRGVRCSSDQVIVVSGVQQALDLLARLLLKQGDPVWMEDPGYFGATIAFGNAGAQIIPVPLDERGPFRLCRSKDMSPCQGRIRNAGAPVPARDDYVARAAHGRFSSGPLTPAPSSSKMTTTANTGSKDVRFRRYKALDRNSNVIFIGSFNKLLFPSLRIGYVVLPPSLVDLFLAFRYRTDFHNLSADQAVLCDFIADGHLGRHLRRMRDLYAGRLAALIDGSKRYLKGSLEISDVRAGLYTAAFLKNGMTSWQAEKAAATRDLEVVALDRYTLKSPDPKGVLLGFAAFDEAMIRAGLIKLAAALGR